MVPTITDGGTNVSPVRVPHGTYGISLALRPVIDHNQAIRMTTLG